MPSAPDNLFGDLCGLSGSIGTSVTNATLAGTGSIANAVAIGNGLGSTGSAIISPGTSGATGTLTTGPLALNSDGEYAFSLNSTGGGAGSGADELIAASLSLNSNAHFTFADIATSPAALTPGTAFVAIQTTGAIIGTFANLPNGYEFISGPNAYQAAYTTDELTLTVVSMICSTWCATRRSSLWRGAGCGATRGQGPLGSTE